MKQTLKRILAWLGVLPVLLLILLGLGKIIIDGGGVSLLILVTVLIIAFLFFTSVEWLVDNGFFKDEEPEEEFDDGP